MTSQVDRDELRELALFLHTCGFNVVPVHYKEPIGSWSPNKRLTKEELKKRLESEKLTGIAIVGGEIENEKKKNLIAVLIDVDNPLILKETPKLAELLEKTAKWKTGLRCPKCGNKHIERAGEKFRCKCGELFTQEEAGRGYGALIFVKKIGDVKLSTRKLEGVDILVNNYQLIPPSLHPSGVRYEWVIDLNKMWVLSPAEFEEIIEEIEEAGGKKKEKKEKELKTSHTSQASHSHLRELSDEEIAQIVEKLKPHYVEGRRQNIWLYLSGWLAKAGVSPVSAAKALVELYNKKQDSDSLKMRHEALVRSYRKAGIDLSPFEGDLAQLFGFDPHVQIEEDREEVKGRAGLEELIGGEICEEIGQIVESYKYRGELRELDEGRKKELESILSEVYNAMEKTLWFTIGLWGAKARIKPQCILKVLLNLHKERGRGDIEELAGLFLGGYESVYLKPHQQEIEQLLGFRVEKEEKLDIKSLQRTLENRLGKEKALFMIYRLSKVFRVASPLDDAVIVEGSKPGDLVISDPLADRVYRAKLKEEKKQIRRTEDIFLGYPQRVSINRWRVFEVEWVLNRGSYRFRGRVPDILKELEKNSFTLKARTAREALITLLNGFEALRKAKFMKEAEGEEEAREEAQAQAQDKEDVPLAEITDYKEYIEKFAKLLVERYPLRHFHVISGDKEVEYGLYLWRNGRYVKCENRLKAEIERIAREENHAMVILSPIVGEIIKKVERLTYTILPREPLRIAFENAVFDWEIALPKNGNGGGVDYDAILNAVLPIESTIEKPCFNYIPHNLNVDFLKEFIERLKNGEEFSRVVEELIPTTTKVFKEWAEENYITLYEIIGYTLLPDYPLNKAIMLLGEGKNGKSTYIRLIDKILGHENISSVKLHDLCNEKFLRGDLFHKLANTYPDLPPYAVKNVDDLKVLTGEDYITVDRKYMSSIRFKNYAKLIFSANELPKVGDQGFAFWRRWIVIRFPNTFDNPGFMLTFDEEEIEKIIVASIIAMVLVYERRKFSCETSVNDVMKVWKSNENSVFYYVTTGIEEGWIEVDPKNEELFTVERDLYEDYCEWCEEKRKEEGRIIKKAKKGFTEDLAKFWGIRQREKRVRGKKIRVYVGIKLNKEVRELQEFEVEEGAEEEAEEPREEARGFEEIIEFRI